MFSTGCPAPERGAAPIGTPTPTTHAAPALHVPPRRSGSATGSAFAAKAARLTPAERERAISEEILAGNLPSFERRLVPVELTAAGDGGRVVRGRVFVVPDYLAIGDDEDFVRVPITIRTARRIAKELDCVLPTTKLVDAIQNAAKVKLASPVMNPGDRMGSMQYFVVHNRVIEEHRAEQGAALGALVSGPKKDLVLTKRMLETPGRTPIYGWFGRGTEPVQPLSLVHDDRHVDYAHGVRLVAQTMEIEGRSAQILDVLADRALAPIVSDEGACDLRTAWNRGW